MKKTNNLILVLLMVVVFAMALSVNALSAAPTPLPMIVQSFGNITYVTGGVGDAEATAMRRLAKDYALELSFTQRPARHPEEFLADVKVQIKDMQQTAVLAITTHEPFLLANMPAGDYLIVAEHDGEIKQKKVSLNNSKHLNIAFVWPVVVSPETGETTK
jgi:hypothetical protein